MVGLAEAGEGATGRLEDGDVLVAAGVTEAAAGSADGATGLLSPPSTALGVVGQVEPRHGSTASEATPQLLFLLRAMYTYPASPQAVGSATHEMGRKTERQLMRN